METYIIVRDASTSDFYQCCVMNEHPLRSARSKRELTQEHAAKYDGHA